MCKEFGWTEDDYNKTSRQTIIQFSLILRTLDEMAKDEAAKAEKKGKSKCR
jgi:hypothetical protein